MDIAIGEDEGRLPGLLDAADGVFKGCVGHTGIDLAEGIEETWPEDDIAEGGASLDDAAGFEIGSVADVVADLGEPLEGGVFNDGFGEIYGWHT
jgi:hypothetical protein